MKLAVQIDFDGTVTEQDISFLLLDTYVGPQWRIYEKEYVEGRIQVGMFNQKVFGMVKADRQTMTDFVLTSDEVKIRPGFRELVDYCNRHNLKTVIVSNGLIFYIDAIMESLGLNGIEIHAAENEFSPDGMRVCYRGPDGAEIDTGFKEAYTTELKNAGYDIMYIGDGASDIYPSRLARYVFATSTLLERCREEKLPCSPFNDFYEIIRGLEDFTTG